MLTLMLDVATVAFALLKYDSSAKRGGDVTTPKDTARANKNTRDDKAGKNNTSRDVGRRILMSRSNVGVATARCIASDV